MQAEGRGQKAEGESRRITVSLLLVVLFLSMLFVPAAMLYRESQDRELATARVSHARAALRATLAALVADEEFLAAPSEDSAARSLGRLKTTERADLHFDVFREGEQEILFHLPVDTERYVQQRWNRGPIDAFVTSTHIIIIRSLGPDGVESLRAQDIRAVDPEWLNSGAAPSRTAEIANALYDPTNGTLSPGDLFQVMPLPGK